MFRSLNNKVWIRSASSDQISSKRPQEVEEPIGEATHIPNIPDDLLLMIFDKLTTEEREPLGTTCKRFRELDFELGNKVYDKIIVNWNGQFHSIYGRGDGYDFGMGHYIPIQSNYHNLRLFKRAKTGTLTIKIDKKCKDADFEIVLRILETVTYKDLSIHFETAQDCGENFIYILVNGRNLDKVMLQWFGSQKHNEKLIRNLVKQLPRIRKLYLTCGEIRIYTNRFTRLFAETITTLTKFVKGSREQCLWDDTTLLHIITCASWSAVFGTDEFTAQGILEVFEVIRQSPIEKKYIIFYASKAIIDELLTISDLGFVVNDARDFIYYIDHESRSKIRMGRDRGPYAVEMGKVDEKEYFLD